jgi:hypothetical protein
MKSLISLLLIIVAANARAEEPVPVTVDNFARAESHKYFTNRFKQGGFGKLFHLREPMPIDNQPVIRGNRDTLYSSGVFDLDAGPVTVTMPDAGDRYMSLMVINEHEHCWPLTYEPGDYTFTKGKIGTRYAMVAARTLFDPRDPTDVEDARKLQDAIKIQQAGGPGTFEVPNWDEKGRDELRAALITLGKTVPDSRRMFGSREQVDPVRCLIGSAIAWGGNIEKDALYLNRYPQANDGKTVHRLVVKDVPVDAFWSVSVYGPDGYFHKNDANAYTVNNLSAKQAADGSVTIQFGGVPSADVNHLPIIPGWNYLVRLYRPRQEILDGSWKFPEAQLQK